MGISLWVQSPNITGGNEDEGNAVAVDELGNVYYTGRCNAPVYFGGTNSVTDGTMTIVWNTLGILRYTHT